MMDSNVLICIFNYKHDDNARRWYKALSPFFDTYVLDSGNDVINDDFIQFDNIYYSGLFNEFKKIFSNGNYVWGGIICSDVTITDENMCKFINRVNWLCTTSNIGIWQAAGDESSRSIHGKITHNEEYQYKLWIEGWLIFMKDSVINKMPYITPNNKFGWNIDIVSEIISHDLHLLNIMDNTCPVHHPVDRGYSENEARLQGREWEKQVLSELNLLKPSDNEIIKKPIEYLDDSITFIIPNRGGDKIDIVIRNFTKTFQEYFTSINFIVIEQCDNYPFMRGQLYNVAVNFCHSKYIGLIDNDIYNIDKFDPKQIYKEFGGAYVAFDYISQLILDESNENNYNVVIRERRTAGFGAFNVMTKTDFEKINGFSNLCFGWGAEDNILNYKINFKRMQHTLGHIQHERRINNTPELTDNNRKILNKYLSRQIIGDNDGYKQTTYKIVYCRKTNNVMYVGVNNIGVTSDFLYFDEYKNAIRYINDYKVDGLIDSKTYNEKLIVTMTSWKGRINNLPVVLGTILEQTKKPDKIIVNLSTEEFVNKENDFSDSLNDFFQINNNVIQINWVEGPNTKQWKKILPTLKLYPHDCIVCIDDDFIYPSDMLNTLWQAHLKYPNNPISGNRVIQHGYQCQCGCASLVKLDYLKNVFDYATPEVQKLHSSDIFFTYVAAKSGNPYIYCGKSYFTNMKRFNEIKPLHNESSARNALNNMWNYLVNTFGNIGGEKKKFSAQANYRYAMGPNIFY